MWLKYESFVCEGVINDDGIVCCPTNLFILRIQQTWLKQLIVMFIIMFFEWFNIVIPLGVVVDSDTRVNVLFGWYNSSFVAV